MPVVGHVERRAGAPAPVAVRSGARRAVLCLGTALASGVLVGAPWLSVKASATPPDPSPSPLVVQLSPEPSSFPHYGEPLDPLDPHCEISMGIYPRPVSSPLPAWLPSWVSPSDGFVCVAVDASSLLDSPNQTYLGPDLGPSLSPDIAALADRLDAWRELYLYSAGLLIFLVSGLLFRARSR